MGGDLGGLEGRPPQIWSGGRRMHPSPNVWRSSFMRCTGKYEVLKNVRLRNVLLWDIGFFYQEKDNRPQPADKRLQRNEKLLTSSCSIISLTLLRPFFDQKLFISQNFWRPLFSHFLAIEKAAGIQLHRQFLLTFFHRSLNTFFTFLAFHFLFSTIALSHLQLQPHNCHFTTANYIIQLQKLSSVAR